ncbi:XRE family transcriptional regulator [Rhodococcus hoagii]|nr:XRE family transcriptional regulator [Prescottella equi]NKS56426.1 XRE family transcriptional regulator [Prescottella equi]NKS56510.1 XRE family transcriptional regulator [Prescottella equi]NKS64837.1 XRE family transcriptional regulator [Prescottella equi]NKS70095.1 XRE family transcriptional regulator [Prescottella equi]
MDVNAKGVRCRPRRSSSACRPRFCPAPTASAWTARRCSRRRPARERTTSARPGGDRRSSRRSDRRAAARRQRRRPGSRLGVKQNRVSNIERGDLANVQLDTLRRYVDAVGGTLRIEVEFGDDRIQIA